MSFTSFSPFMKSVHNIKSSGGQFHFKRHRGDLALVGSEDIDGSSIAEV